MGSFSSIQAKRNSHIESRLQKAKNKSCGNSYAMSARGDDAKNSNKIETFITENNIRRLDKFKAVYTTNKSNASIATS